MVFLKSDKKHAIFVTQNALLWYHQDLKIRTGFLRGLTRPYFVRSATGQVTMARVEKKW